MQPYESDCPLSWSSIAICTGCTRCPIRCRQRRKMLLKQPLFECSVAKETSYRDERSEVIRHTPIVPNLRSLSPTDSYDLKNSAASWFECEAGPLLGIGREHNGTTHRIAIGSNVFALENMPKRLLRYVNLVKQRHPPNVVISRIAILLDAVERQLREHKLYRFQNRSRRRETKRST